MKTHDQRGELNILLIPLVLVAILFVGATSFAIWAFMGKQDYQKNTDQKIAVANAEVKKQTQAEDAKLYAEEAKNPLRTYNGPDVYGSVSFDYPKTWSAYQASYGTTTGLDVLFNPGVVPASADKASTFALRVKVVPQQYDTIIKQFSTNKNVTIAPYKLPKLDSLVGTRVEGQIQPNKQGVMIVFQVRDKTLQVWTESATYLPDLDSIILPSLTFVP